MPKLLLEIGTEEIPAGYIAPALAALRKMLFEKLALGGFYEDRGLSARTYELEGKERIRSKFKGQPTQKPDESEVNVTATPRRLVAFVSELPARSAEKTERVKGPPAGKAFDEKGKPTKAAQGFARKNGVKVADLATEGGYVWAEVRRGGGKLDEFLTACLPEVIAALPFPKSMRWRPGEKTSFARPVRSLLCLLDTKAVPFEFAGLKAGKESHGHPFHAPEAFTLREARYGFYKEALKGRKVLVDTAERRRRVLACVSKGAEKAGGEMYDVRGVGQALVEEVTNLVEWPGAVIGSFDEELCRELPDEVIVAAMTGHQRYFPVKDGTGKLLPKFVAIANRDPRSGGKASVIRAGNERVLRARLADALFFWREDSKKRLAERLADLEGVVFHEKLGSMRQKAGRLAELARWLATESGQEQPVAEAAERGALLAKCDLVTHMVFEFPELQGVMGKHYAKEDGEPSSVRQAIEEHYLPRSAEDNPPRSQVGRMTALADKFDSIVGGFAAGLAPTGNKDPYALRRAALGIIAIIRKGKLFRSGPGLAAIVAKARELYRRQNMLTDAGEELDRQVLEFFRDRLEAVLAEKAPRVEVLRAVLAAGFEDLSALEARLKAVTDFARREEFAELCTVAERARNIVRKERELVAGRPEPQKKLLAEPAEKKLFEVYLATGVRFRTFVKEGSYREASELYLQSFAKPLHKFFEDVFVNVENMELRKNRLALLDRIYHLYADSVADLAECAGQAKAE